MKFGLMSVISKGNADGAAVAGLCDNNVTGISVAGIVGAD